MKIFFKSKDGVFNAKGAVKDEDHWYVYKGSCISPNEYPGISKTVIALRNNNELVVNNILKKEIEFKSASMAAQFVCGYVINGMVAWRTENGDRISEHIKGKKRRPPKSEDAGNSFN